MQGAMAKAMALVVGCAAISAAYARGAQGGKLEVLSPWCKEPAANKIVAKAMHNEAQIQACRKNQADCVTCESSGGTTLHGTIEHEEALFGIPQYAGKLTGSVFYGTPHDKDACMPYPSTPWAKQISAGDPIIVLVDRGNCTFVQKVRNAQSSSANAVIIVDNIVEDQLPLMADDGTGSDINIPAVFISKAEGQRIKDAIANGLPVQAELSWSLPQPDNRVEWSFWTSSNDDESIKFVKDFKAADEALAEYAELTPHYLVIDGHTFGCVTDDPTTLPCGKQCSHGGRYCAEDPEHDFDVGLDGEDVVLENLRQICIWQVTNSTGQPAKWWDYVQLFDEQCEVDEDYDEECSQHCQSLAELTPAQLAAVAKCVSDSESATNCPTDDVSCLRSTMASNPLLELELKARREDGVFILPTIMINTQKYRGRLTCPHPINQMTCGVLQAICSGFQEAEKVPACAPDHCWKTIDDCGDCRDSKQDVLYNKGCCDKTPGNVFDACGKCGGTGAFDKCSKCRQRNDPRFDDCNIYDTDGQVIGKDVEGLAEAGTVDDKGNFIKSDPAIGGNSGGNLTGVIVTFTIVIIVMVIAGFLYIKKRDDANRRHVENVVAQYMHLPDSAEGGGSPMRRANNDEADTAKLTFGQG